MSRESFREFWIYRELLYFLAWRDVKVRYSQTVLGVGWAIIQPLLSVFVFTVFFGKFAGVPSEGTPHPVFYFCGLLPWLYFSSTLSNSGNSLVNNAQLVTKVYFPRAVLPASAALSGLVDFFIGSAFFLPVIYYYGITPTWHMMFWPLMVVPLILIALGTSMFLAALNVKYRDIKYTVPFLIQLGLFVTPVIYPMSIIPESYRNIAALNPLCGIIEAFRATIVPSKQLDWSLLAISTVVTLSIFLSGYVYFRKTERWFAEIV
jgi:lipopolysaccharide transport system permease protein